MAKNMYIVNDVESSMFTFDMEDTLFDVNYGYATGDDTQSNVIGEGYLHLRTCGIRPLGIGKRGKEKLAEYDQCVADNQKLQQEKEETKIDTKKSKNEERRASAASEKTQSEALKNISTDNTQPGGMPAWGWALIAVGGIVVIIGGIALFKKFGAAKVVAPPVVA